MRMDIIDSLQNDYSKKNLVDVEGRIVKFKIFQNIQDKKAENISVINTFIKEGYLRRLNNLKKYIKEYAINIQMKCSCI